MIENPSSGWLSDTGSASHSCLGGCSHSLFPSFFHLSAQITLFMDFHFHSNLNRLLLVRVFHLGRLRIPFTREWRMENGYFRKQSQRWKSSLTEISILLLRKIKNKAGSCGQNQTRAEAGIFYWMLQSSSLRTADVFPVDDRKYVWCSQASFQGAHGWNYFNKADHSRLSWHLSSMLVNVSWLDSCMGSSHDCSCLLEDAKVRTVR